MHYYCLDDVPESRHAILQNLRSAGEPRELTLTYASKRISSEDLVSVLADNPCDGVILDLLLTFRGEGAFKSISNAYAQAIRDAVALDRISDIPIVLWSSAQKYDQYYEPEPTGHDLYDWRIEKSSLAEGPGQLQQTVTTLLSLASGYKKLSEHKRQGRAGLAAMLDVKGKAFTRLDPRIGDRYVGKRTAPCHDYARYIRKQPLEQPRPLVDERLLGARLGIDIDSPGDGWAVVQAALSQAKYTGIFGDAWQRWWWDGVEEWWRSLDSERRVLSELPARLRVTCINDALRTSLRAAEPIEGCSDHRFWAVCEIRKKPVALSDAFESSLTSDLRWHDARYVSVPAALDAPDEAVTPVERAKLHVLRDR